MVMGNVILSITGQAGLLPIRLFKIYFRDTQAIC